MILLLKNIFIALVFLGMGSEFSEGRAMDLSIDSKFFTCQEAGLFLEQTEISMNKSLFEEAQELYKTGKYEKAFDKYAEIIDSPHCSKDIKNPCILEQGNCQFQLSNFNQALTCYKNVALANVTADLKARSLHNYGIVAASHREYTVAIKFYLNSLKVCAPVTPVRAYNYYELGRATFFYGLMVKEYCQTSHELGESTYLRKREKQSYQLFERARKYFDAALRIIQDPTINNFFDKEILDKWEATKIAVEKKMIAYKKVKKTNKKMLKTREYLPEPELGWELELGGKKESYL